MLKLLIIALIYGCLALNCHSYANVNSERENISRDEGVNDFYGDDSNYVDEKRGYEPPNDDGGLRENDEGEDDFQRDAEAADAAEIEEDDEPINHFSYKTELMDAIHHGIRADPGCSWKWVRCSSGCCLKAFKCRDCRKKFYLLCGAYLYPAKQGKRLLTASMPTTDQSDWMKKHKSKKLKDIIMPGSHHSGVNIMSRGLRKWDVPQTMSVTDQLKAGVRFLDVRVATGPWLRQPSIVHAFKYQDFQKLIRSIVYFLRKHQSEVVIIRLKKGDGIFPKWTVNWKHVDSVLQNYASHMNTKSSPMRKKLSELGGKIVICQDGTKSSFKTMTCKGSWVKTHTNNPAKLPSRMTTWLDDLPSRKSSWRFNYLEAICTAKKVDALGIGCKRDGDKALYRFSSLKEMASECNYKVFDWLKEKKRDVAKKVNSVMTDFANPKILNYIINMN